MAERPLRLPPSSSENSSSSTKRTLKERVRNALITGTAGGYLGGILVPEGKVRVKVPALLRKALKMKRRKTVGIHGARAGVAAGALIGGRNKGERSETVDAVATGGDWKFEERKPLTPGQKAALAGGGVLTAGGLVLGTARGRNALRSAMAGGSALGGLLSKAPGGQPRRVRLMKAQQKRKDLSNQRAANKAVEGARAKFRAEALPKAPAEPTLGDAVKTVRKRVKRKVVKAVSNIGANPGEVQLAVATGGNWKFGTGRKMDDAHKKWNATRTVSDPWGEPSVKSDFEGLREQMKRGKTREQWQRILKKMPRSSPAILTASLLKKPRPAGTNPWHFSAYVEDMTFSGLPKEVQKDVLRFVDAEKGTPVVHYGMTVKELIGKADPENLKAARKALGTLRASRAADEVMGKIKDGSKYVLLMNDRIVDGHHFLAKAERAGVTSSLNVLDLTPARLSTRQMSDRQVLWQFAEEQKKSGWKRKAAIAAGATAGAVLGARTLPRLIRRGRPLKEGEELAGKVLYTHEGLTTPASVVNIGGKTVRRRLEKKALKGSKLAGAALKVDDFLGVPQRHYGVGAGGGRVIEKTKAHGHRMVNKDGFSRGNRIHVDSDTLPKDSNKWGEWAKGMEKRNEAAQGKAKRGDLCLIGNNCEHHARDIAGQGRKSYQTRAIVGGAAGGAVAGGAAVGAVTKRKREEKQMSANAMLWEFAPGDRAMHALRGLRLVSQEQRAAIRKKPLTQLKPFTPREELPQIQKNLRDNAAAKLKWLRAGKPADQLRWFEFEEPPPRERRNRVRDLRDRIGLAKDVAALAGVTAAGVGGVKLYRAGQKAIKQTAPQVKAAARAWHRAGVKTGKTLDTVKDAVAPAAATNRGIKAVGSKIGAIARKATMWMHDDPRPVRAFARRREPVGVQPQRDGWQKARDASLIAGGVATVGGAGYLAHKGGEAISGLAKRGLAAMRQVPQVTDNIQNATSIGADMGRVYRKARKVVTDSADAFKGGLREAAGKPAPSWAKKVVRVGKKLRLLESRGPSFKFQVSSSKEQDEKPKRPWRAAGYARGVGMVAGGVVGNRAGDKAADVLRVPRMVMKKGIPGPSGKRFALKMAGTIAGTGLGLATGDKVASKLKLKEKGSHDLRDAIKEGEYTRSNIASYVKSGVLGSGAGMAVGGLLRGRRGVSGKSALAGAVAGLAGRAALQKKINREEDRHLADPKRHRIGATAKSAIRHGMLNAAVPAAAVGTMVGVVAANRKKLGKHMAESKTGRKIRAWVLNRARRRNPAKPDKTVARRKGPLIDADTGLPVRALPEKRMQSRQALNEFIIGALGTIAGTLAGSAAGNKFRYPVQNALKKRLVPKLGVKWGRRVARSGAYLPENAGALAGGAAGSLLTGGMRKRKAEEEQFQVPSSKFQVSEFNARALRALHEFGGREQLKDIDSSGFLDPLDVFVGRKKGYTGEQVKDYNRQKRYISDVKSGKRKGTPEAIKAAEDLMRSVRDNPTKAAHGQVVRSVLRKGDTVRKVSERGGGLIRDAAKELRGEGREKDRWGREKKREWEKPWFQRTKNQVIGAAALGGGALLLRKNPKIRAKVDRAIRVGKRKVNSVLPDLFPDAKPLRKAGQKTTATVQAKQQQAAQAKAAKTQAQVAQAAQSIAAQAAAVKKVKPSAAPKRAAKSPAPAKPAAPVAPKPVTTAPVPKQAAPKQAPVLRTAAAVPQKKAASKPAVVKKAPAAPQVKAAPKPQAAPANTQEFPGSAWGASKLANEPKKPTAAEQAKPKKPKAAKPGVPAPKPKKWNGLTGKWEFAEKPFDGYNSKRHARTGGLNDSFRKSYNRENGANLKRPVTTKPSKLKAGSEAAGRRKSFCARMGGMPGATSKGGKLTPKGAALRRWNCMAIQALTQFADPLDVGWDIRDARGNSARVFAPQAGQRDRRPKRWHERVENERKLWAGAALTSTLAGGAAMRKLLGRQSDKAVKEALKRQAQQIGTAVKKRYVKKAAGGGGGKTPNVVRFDPAA